MVKNYVLDTNVLIHNPNAIFAFKENDLTIPLPVIEELDRLKSLNDERGRNARLAARTLEKLLINEKDIGRGAPLPGGGTIRVALPPDRPMPLGLDPKKADNLILQTAQRVQEENQGATVILVSMDLNARIKSHALGLKAEDFRSDKVHLEALSSGYRELTVSEETIDLFYSTKTLLEDDPAFPERAFCNEFFILKDEATGKGKSALARYKKAKTGLVPLRHLNDKPMGIQPLNIEQKFALELLLNDKIQLVCLLGKAGTGKTLLALAAGLKKTLDEKAFRKVSVSRPVIPMGKDIGYLPGSKDDKLFHWMRPIFDNLEFIFTQNRETQEQAEKAIAALEDRGTLEIEALTYIRGRSLARDYFIVDEAQNLTPHEVKTIVSRAGTGTKVVLTGDIYQIDNPYLDASSNGLTYCVEKFKNQELFGSIILTRAERSNLSDLASHLL